MSRITKVPKNGICLFCGIASNDEKEGKKIVVDFEPIKPIKSSVYVCDSHFHIESLKQMACPHEKYGYIIVGGQRCIIGCVSGDNRKIIEAFNVEVNKSQKKGGQSALRFQRIKDETRHNLIVKVSEAAKRCFISNGLPNVTGIILAGCAQLKNELQSSELLGDKLKNIVMAIFDVAYDGEQGFYEAIRKSKGFLQNVELLREQQEVEKLFDYAGKGGNCAFGVKEVMQAWYMGAIKEIFVSKSLDIVRFIDESKEDVQFALNNEDISVKTEPLIDWIIVHYKEFGITLHLVSDSFPEGVQLKKGLGGIGAILRYKVELDNSNNNENDYGDFDYTNHDSDFDFDSDFEN